MWICVNLALRCSTFDCECARSVIGERWAVDRHVGLGSKVLLRGDCGCCLRGIRVVAHFYAVVSQWSQTWLSIHEARILQFLRLYRFLEKPYHVTSRRCPRVAGYPLRSVLFWVEEFRVRVCDFIMDDYHCCRLIQQSQSIKVSWCSKRIIVSKRSTFLVFDGLAQYWNAG